VWYTFVNACHVWCRPVLAVTPIVTRTQFRFCFYFFFLNFLMWFHALDYCKLVVCQRSSLHCYSFVFSVVSSCCVTHIVHGRSKPGCLTDLLDQGSWLRVLPMSVVGCQLYQSSPYILFQNMCKVEQADLVDPFTIEGYCGSTFPAIVWCVLALVVMCTVEVTVYMSVVNYQVS